MAFCLPKEFANKFTQALKNGEIVPEKLAAMSSAERRTFFEQIVGKEHAKEVNALFESKLLLKDYKTGLVSWAKKVGGMSEAVRRDLIARIEKLDHVFNPADEHAFLSDLVAQKLGADVTMDEAKNISTLAKATDELKAKIPETSPIRSDERLQYGLAVDQYHQYLNHLLGKDKGMTFKEFITTPSKWFETVAGATKGVLAAFDNSYFGRQGIKMLYTNPTTWAKAFAKSWGDAAKVMKGGDAMQAIRADIFSRPNAINGKYLAGKYALGINFEEDFPSHLPERVPVLGSLYKASEAMFNGAALRLRADYADKIIGKAEEMGINALDPVQAKGLGTLVNSMTGRGDIGRLTQIGDHVNTAFFSIRFLKSNFDTLTMHRLGFAIDDLSTRAFVRRQAAANLLKIVGGTAAILTIANALQPGSVETDPRSTNFGKIKIGATTFDITGGMASLLVLAARLATNESKSATTGRVVPLGTGKFGSQTRMDVMDNFWQGKLSPIAGAFRDVFKGTDFNNNKVTPASVLANMTTPLPVQTMQDLMNNPKSAPFLAAMILDGLGFSTYTPQVKKK